MAANLPFLNMGGIGRIPGKELLLGFYYFAFLDMSSNSVLSNILTLWIKELKRSI